MGKKDFSQDKIWMETNTLFNISNHISLPYWFNHHFIITISWYSRIQLLQSQCPIICSQVNR